MFLNLFIEIIEGTVNMEKIVTKIVKASFKDCPVAERKLFNQSSCLMPISVGQSVHENEKFKATIELISRTFKSCTILVDDTVQRHTFKINSANLSDSDAYKQSLIAGDQWIERNCSTYEKMSIPCNIIRWDKWLYHNDFNNQLKFIQNLYNNDLTYKKAIDENINDYIKRNVQKELINNFDLKRVSLLCLDYLQEECAAMTLWPEGNYNFEVYPTGRNKAMAATYESIIKYKNPELLKSVSLRFKKS